MGKGDMTELFMGVYKDHPLFPLASIPCTIASIIHNHFALFGNGDPNAVELDHFGDLLERGVVELVNQRRQLIDPLVHRSEPDRMTNRGTPSITDVTQALATPTT